MDVNLTISLMRGQMGVVIEKAVNAAVETVLGEMIRVVSLKFEQLRREMSAKDKENQDIRKMLETSRCQMKVLRQKYINALNAKEHRQAFLQHRHILAQFSAPAAHHHVPAEPSTRAAAHTGSAAEFHTSAPKPPSHEPTTQPAPKTHTAIHQETKTNPELRSSQEVPGPNAHMGLKVESSSVTLPGGSDPHWAQTPLVQAEAEHTDTSDPPLPPVPHFSEVLTTAEAKCRERPARIKQEEDEVEIVQVKQELVNPITSEGAGTRIGLHPQGAGAGMSRELPVSQRCDQIPGPSVTEPLAFRGLDPGTYSESQLAVAGAQRHVRPYCKDLSLYEDYKRKRSEVRKRSETRRRELEQTLPQALLADLVKERREKTRLRVARWRAKRKLQACLMAQAGQFNSTQALYTQCNGRRRAGPASEQGNISLGTVQPESGVYTMPLQMGSGPLLTTQRLNMAEGQMQPGAATFLQQRTSATETYQ